MKRLLLLAAMILLLIMVGCSEDNEPTETAEPSTTVSGEAVTPDSPSVPTAPDSTQASMSWAEYTDETLVEMVLKDRSMEYIFLHDVTSDSVLYIMENCEAFQELMFRETALESLERYTPMLIAKWRVKTGALNYRLNALCLAKLVSYLIPDVAEFLNEIAYPSWDDELISGAARFYTDTVAMAQSVEYADIQDRFYNNNDASVTVIKDEFFTLREHMVLKWDVLCDDLFAVTAFVRSDDNPEGSNVTHFVGCIDDQWLVMISVDQIPEGLKAGLDLSQYQ